VAHTGCRGVLGLSATNDVLVELRSGLQCMASRGEFVSSTLLMDTKGLNEA